MEKMGPCCPRNRASLEYWKIAGKYHTITLRRNPFAALIPLHLPQMTKAYQPFVLLIPESEGDRLQAGEQGQRFHVPEHGIGMVAPFQVIIGDPGAEMVNMMESDIAREPLENFWELVERAALHRGRGVVPGFTPLPVGVFELVLHIKQPDASRARYRHGDDLNNQPWHEAEDGDQNCSSAEQCKVHHPD